MQYFIEARNEKIRLKDVDHTKLENLISEYNFRKYLIDNNLVKELVDLIKKSYNTQRQYQEWNVYDLFLQELFSLYLGCLQDYTRNSNNKLVSTQSNYSEYNNQYLPYCRLIETFTRQYFAKTDDHRRMIKKVAHAIMGIHQRAKDHQEKLVQEIKKEVKKEKQGKDVMNLIGSFL